MRQPVELKKAYRLLNHGPTVLVTSAHAGQKNVMAAAWNMALDFEPAKVCVVIDKSTYTRALVEASGEFGLNIPDRSMAAATLAVGDRSGKAADKFAELKLATFASQQISVPLLEACIGWLECKLIPEVQLQQRYDLFIGEVVAAWADASVFSDGHWHFPAGNPKSIHYIAGGTFFETGDEFTVAK
jgi:flavin reductase (DIM6/NTAB) family NADH-FMN oxidoreductase RutF